MINSALLEITNKCNLKCIHCFYSDYISTYEMSIENIAYTIGKISALENLEYIGVTGGEPFLHSRFIDILKMFGDNFSKTRFLIITNGILLNDEILNLFSVYKNIAINISVDGSNRQINDMIRGNGTYDKLIESIEKVAAIDNNRLNLRMTIQKGNYKDVSDFFHLAKKYNVSANYLFVAECGTAKLKWDEVGLSTSNKMYCYNELKKLYKSFNIDTPPPSDPEGCGLFDNIIINPKGNIYFCNILNSIFPDYFIGNIFKDSMELIENALDKNELTDELSLWQRRLLETECGGCEVIKSCGQGCYGMYLARKNRIGGSRTDNSLSDGNCVSKKYKYLIDQRDGSYAE